MKDYLVLAIKSLRPSCEFTLQNDNYATIEWHILDGKAPTKAQVDAEIERIKSSEIAAEADKAIAKSALLERLGITAEEASLLLA